MVGEADFGHGESGSGGGGGRGGAYVEGMSTGAGVAGGVVQAAESIFSVMNLWVQRLRDTVVAPTMASLSSFC